MVAGYEMSAIYLIDTSYLIELYKIPGESGESAIQEIHMRFEIAIINKSRLYVPLPCIFELGNHIAKIQDGRGRRELAQKLFLDVKDSVETSKPWITLPSVEIGEALRRLCKAFSENYQRLRIGLTDSFIIEEANRLKRDQDNKFGFKVHIWTKDKALKTYEPDTEENPFTGS